MKITNIHDIPRVTNKLSICLNPMKRISLESEEITGLSNDLLEYERKFDENTMTLLNSFLERLQQPVCLIAHNGNRFDFPILKQHITKLSASLPQTVVFCDSLSVFRKIDQINDKTSRILVNGFILKSTEVIKDEQVKLMNEEILKAERQFIEDKSDEDDNEEIKKLEQEFIEMSEENVKGRQETNEKTPQKHVAAAEKHNHPSKSIASGIRKRPNSNARRQLFPLDDDKNVKSPKGKFTLKEIYKRFFNEYPPNSHDSEADVYALLKCACACNKIFVDIVKVQCVYFDNV